MKPEDRRTFRALNQAYGGILLTLFAASFSWAWHKDIGIDSYLYFDGTKSLWQNTNSVFASKAGAILIAYGEFMWGLYSGVAALLIHNLGLAGIQKDIALLAPIAPIALWSAIDDKTALGPAKQPQVLNLEFLGLRPIFGRREYNLRKDFCFYLGPFSEEISSIYFTHIADPLRTIGFNVRRGDEIFGSRPVMDDIWDAINESYIIIADVTGRNPNVMYEIGMAHTVGKKVIILTQSMDDVPFDLRHIRCIVYATSPEGLLKLQTRVLTTVQYEVGLLTATDLANQ